jgi:hypothetical protein
MNLVFFSNPPEKLIVKETFDWVSQVLSKPHPFFNNLPPCPYAKNAILDGRVALLFKHEKNFQVLYKAVSEFDDNFDVAVIFDLKYEKDPDLFHEYLDDLNTVISEGMFIDRDIWVMGFHPDDEGSEFESDVEFEASTDDEYAMVFVQRLSALQKAADKLDKKGYYANYRGLYNADDIYSRRAELLRRLKNGTNTT